MTLNASQFALNPLQYIATDDGWLDSTLAPPLEARLADIRDSGFTAIQCDVPDGLAPEQFRSLLAEYGIRPGPGYIDLQWDDDPAVRSKTLDAARATTHANLVAGEPLLFLSMGMDPDAPRVVGRAAIGAYSDRAHLGAVTDFLGAAAEVVSAEGAVAALHPHVGSWIETADEARYVLDSVEESILKFGPDAGHLAWTGVDPTEIMTEYAHRIAGIHVKDAHLDVAQRGRAEGWDYRRTTSSGLWTEPGRGDLDIPRIIATLPEGFDGWVVFEVDKGSVPAPQSVADTGRWLHEYLAAQPH